MPFLYFNFLGFIIFRADHSLQDVRSKLFPFKRKKIKAEEVPSPISLPTKRKERSISSLVVNTPKVKPTGLTGRRTRAVARKAAAAAALRGLGPIVDPVKKEIDSCDSHSQSSSLPANSSKAPQTRRQILSNAEASNHSSNKDTEGDSKELADKAELWQPLNCLVEAANRTKSFRSSSQNPIVKGEQLNGSPSSTYASKTKARENLQRSKIEDDKKDVPMPTILPKRRGQGTARRRRELQAPAAAKPDAAAAQNEKKFSSIWFSLVASFDQQGDPPLPQIPSHYLRIKDGNVPASSIQKYLMQKLSLPSGDKVLRAASEPYATSAQFSRAVAEGKSDTGNSDHDWLLRERVCNGADIRTAKGPWIVKAPCKNSTHFPPEAAIASHLLAFQEVIEDKVSLAASQYAVGGSPGRATP
ncbi:hypothetical protein SEVIR_9G161500v4 [Setaria viridis]